MRATFAIAALAGSVLAAPHYGQPRPHQEVKEVENVHVVVETVVHTVYVTDDGYAAPTPAPEPEYEAPAVTTVVYEEPAAPTYEPAPEPTYEAPAPTPVAPAPSTNTGYMQVVDTWRSNLGLPAFKQSSKLEANAMNCVQASNGNMVHKLNPGSYGQVLAPGQPDEFEHVYVGGWLCENPSYKSILAAACKTQSSGWSYDSDGHFKLLTADYKEIGCAWNKGIWACDLA